MHGFWSLRQLFVERVSPALREEVGLGVPEVFLMDYIGKSDLSPSEIAARMRLPAHTISRRLDALEKRRLITRSLDPNDARRRVLHLTPAGETLLREAAAMLEGQVAALLSVLEPDALQGMLDALERLSPARPKSTPVRCTPLEETL